MLLWHILRVDDGTDNLRIELLKNPFQLLCSGEEPCLATELLGRTVGYTPGTGS